MCIAYTFLSLLTNRRFQLLFHNKLSYVFKKKKAILKILRQSIEGGQRDSEWHLLACNVSYGFLTPIIARMAGCWLE